MSLLFIISLHVLLLLQLILLKCFSIAAAASAVVAVSTRATAKYFFGASALLYVPWLSTAPAAPGSFRLPTCSTRAQTVLTFSDNWLITIFVVISFLCIDTIDVGAGVHEHMI